MMPADDSREREYSGHLANYYDEVISCLRPARSILLFGPGEAKGELRKRIERNKLDVRITRCETSDKMTERQIAQKVRRHYLPSSKTLPLAEEATGDYEVTKKVLLSRPIYASRRLPGRACDRHVWLGDFDFEPGCGP